MKPSKPDALTLAIPAKERCVYAKARTILVRKMKTQAPELGELILHELRMRKPSDIAESYLDDIWWCGRQHLRSLTSGKPSALTLAVPEAAWHAYAKARAILTKNKRRRSTN